MFFTPRYLKEGRETFKAARKLLDYQRDLLAAEEIGEIEGEIRALGQALKARDPEGVKAVSTRLEAHFHRIAPPRPFAGLRENCEVFLVAIVIAIGVRTYFLQPFTIPTGSMQPTLNGIIAHVTGEEPPGVPRQVAEFALLGRDYVNVVSARDDELLEVREVKKFRFFTFSEIVCRNQKFTVHVPANKLVRDFGLEPGRRFASGEVIARGYVDTGDHVFVDKLSYHFRSPRRGEIFVFNTGNIAGLTRPGEPSQFYIKRLAGLPGDTLRIDPPDLYVNGEKATEPGFLRVMSAEDGYRGYSNAASQGRHFPFLGYPDQTFSVGPGHYFALGDNSYDSLDSRSWRTVPEQNLTGRGLFVYWPFTSHWGFMK